MRGKAKLDFLLKQTELFTQFILLQGRGGLKAGSKEAKKLALAQSHAIGQMQQLSQGNTILGTKKRVKGGRANLSYGEGAVGGEEDPDANVLLTRLDR